MKKYLESYPKTWKYHGILSDRKSGNPESVMPRLIAVYYYFQGYQMICLQCS